MTSLVVRKVKNSGTPTLEVVSVVPRVISEGLVKLERVQVICPACGQQVEAVATDGRVKGYCAVAKQYVDFPITQGIAVRMDSQTNAVASVTAATVAHTGRHLTAETRAKMSAAHTGKHPTAETRAKISAALTSRHNRKEGDRGITPVP